MRTNRPQHLIPPPSYPDFVFKMSMRPYLELIEWAQLEYRSRLRYLAEHGYYKTLKDYNENYSPYRILAELTGFRRYISYLSQNKHWSNAPVWVIRFLKKSFGLRELLFRRENGIS